MKRTEIGRFSLFGRVNKDRSGNFAIATALLLPLLLVTAGGAVDVFGAIADKEHAQERLDAAVLAAVHESEPAAQKAVLEEFVALLQAELSGDVAGSLAVTYGSDGQVTASITAEHPSPFLSLMGIAAIPFSVTATATADYTSISGNACIHVLANKNDAVVINTGAYVQSNKCEAHLMTSTERTFIMNAGSTISLSKFCVKGTGYLKNGGTLSNLKTGCDAQGDPYKAGFVEPTLPKTCTTTGAIDLKTVTLKPGLHCNVNFNSAATITFEPGLHIISGMMQIAPNSTVIADGVTFYYPNTDSGLRSNGGITFTGIAPDKGTYAGVLMFEKTSDATNNANKQQFIFNGSKGETLSGIIHLPNRDVVYNAVSNQTATISLVANTMIINQANWKIEPYSGKGATAASVKVENVRLVN